MILSSNFKGYLSSVAACLHCVTATVICIQSKTENIFSEKASTFTVWSFHNFVLVIFGVILTLGKHNPKGYLSEKTRIMAVVKRVQEWSKALVRQCYAPRDGVSNPASAKG